ncbi:MAG TPA: hypothetical protein VGL22_06445 [Terracidiphilus sp.]|jgi:hypothetical protein
MNQDWVVLLVCLAIIATPAALLYAAGRGYLSAVATMAELRSSLNHVLLDTEKIHHATQLQKPVLCDAHKRISAVTKALEKPAP